MLWQGKGRTIRLFSGGVREEIRWKRQPSNNYCTVIILTDWICASVILNNCNHHINVYIQTCVCLYRLWLICFLQTHSVLLYKMLIDGLESCVLLVDYCYVFVSCLDSHSDGTHSLQRIHWWAYDVIYVPKKKQTHLNLVSLLNTFFILNKTVVQMIQWLI